MHFQRGPRRAWRGGRSPPSRRCGPDPAPGQDEEAPASVGGSLDDSEPPSPCFERWPGSLVASIATIDEGPLHPDPCMDTPCGSRPRSGFVAESAGAIMYPTSHLDSAFQFPHISLNQSRPSQRNAGHETGQAISHWLAPTHCGTVLD